MIYTLVWISAVSLAASATIDRREEEGWNHLYAFGERFNDKQIGSQPWNEEIELGFNFPYYGFSFNSTFIFPEGFLAFSNPRYTQPPYIFPNPDWPRSPDPSLIAIFMTDQTYLSLDGTRISHVWYRVANRTQDPELLNKLTEDMVGSGNDFSAGYALIVTWERMAYGGMSASVQVKEWQNTYQLVLATDQLRSYVMFNYANINWTSSTSAGALSGRSGKQSALVGFNGGNGTGFVELPYSAEGNSYKLVQDGNTQTAGRWLARVDDDIVLEGPSASTVLDSEICNDKRSRCLFFGSLASNECNADLGGFMHKFCPAACKLCTADKRSQVKNVECETGLEWQSDCKCHKFCEGDGKGSVKAICNSSPDPDGCPWNCHCPENMAETVGRCVPEGKCSEAIKCEYGFGVLQPSCGSCDQLCNEFGEVTLYCWDYQPDSEGNCPWQCVCKPGFMPFWDTERVACVTEEQCKRMKKNA